ncbi:MAG: phosphopentomutase [Saprospiraceae bacterium]|nr:phosphopentomutase [Saprospiraceae bacterium]
MMKDRRVILIILDSVGIGALPDAHLYNDDGAHTLGHIFEQYPQIHIPHLLSLGLGNIDGQNNIPKVDNPKAHFGKLMEASAGKDTTTGHWEIAGTILQKPFPVFENGFPEDFIQAFEKAIGSEVIGNYAASGTTIIQELGDEHVRTGKPIVYTSADSVFQIAMHESIIPIERQYEICTIARKMLKDDLEVGRVIARPFTGNSGSYTRTSNRKDFAILPPNNLLTSLADHGYAVHGVGKIYDIFAGHGITSYTKSSDNEMGMQKTLDAMDTIDRGLIFTNLVDFDMLYGHRRDVVGYAKCLEAFDKWIPSVIQKMHINDILIITADHGNDPTHSGTDHTREYIPILIYHKPEGNGLNIGERKTFADIAKSISNYFGVPLDTKGTVFELPIFNMA